MTGGRGAGSPIFRVGTIHTGADAVGYLGPAATTDPMQPPVWSPDNNWAFFTFGGNLYAWHVGEDQLTPLGYFFPEAALPATPPATAATAPTCRANQIKVVLRGIPGLTGGQLAAAYCAYNTS